MVSGSSQSSTSLAFNTMISSLYFEPRMFYIQKSPNDEGLVSSFSGVVMHMCSPSILFNVLGFLH